MKIRVPVIGTVNKSVQVETDAPSRAEVTAAISAAIAANTGGSSAPSVTTVIWRFIREVPANIVKLAALTTSGLVTRKADGAIVTRSVAVADTSRLTVTDGDGDGGDPTLDLANISSVSVWGRAANTSGKPAAIQAGNNDRLLARTADQITFRQLTDDMVPANTVALSKLANASAASKLVGRESGSAGAWEEITLGANLSISGTTLNAAGGDLPVSIGKSQTATYTPSITNPTSMSFKMLLQMRPMEPLCPQLQTFFDDMMEDCGFYTLSGNTTTPVWSQSQVQLKSTAASFGNGMNVETKQRFEQPGVCIMIEGITATPDANANALAVQWRKSGNDFIIAYIETGGGTNTRINLAKGVAGVFIPITNTTNGSLPAGITGLALSVSATGLCVVYQNVANNGWAPIMSASVTDWNFISPSELAQWFPAMQVTGGVTVPWKIGGFRTGYQGQTWLRDFRIVTLKDGTPYVSNGFLYFTATTDQCSVFRMNPKNGSFAKVGALIFDRSGTHYADLNAHILWDEAIGAWRVFWATWGNNSFTNVRMWATTYKGDILNGVHLIDGGAQLTLSQTSGNNATYDAAVIWDAANSRWLMAYTLSPSGTFAGNFYAVLDSSPDLVTWSNVFAKSGTTGYEGSWMSVIGGNYFVTAGNGSNYRCWDAAGTDLGTISVDTFPSPGSNPPPHFIFFPWFDRGITEYYALSWNNTQFSVAGSGLGTFATGTPVLYKATDTETGFEFDAIGVR